MSRMLSALRVLHGRSGTSPDGAGAAVENAHAAEPALPPAIGTPIELDRAWNRFETRLSNASTLARALLADEALDIAASIDESPAAGPVWELPPLDPATSYRDLALQLSREAGSADGRGPVLLAAVRGTAMDGFNVVELAVALGEAGGEVLVIDLQRIAPQGTVQAGTAPPVGLAQLLSATATWPEIIHRTSRQGISFVGQGRPEPLPSHWQDQMGQNWKQLPGQWRHVLVSGGAFDRPLTLAIAGVCRSAYLVVELGEDRSGAISAALSALRTAGANVQGAIAIAQA